MDLELMLQNAQRDIEDFKAQITNARTDQPDELDRARVQEDINFMQSQLLRKQADLQKIRLAMQKKSKGTFGICDECGCDIDQKRLLINPAYDCCTDCQDCRELTEKKLGFKVDHTKKSILSDSSYV